MWDFGAVSEFFGSLRRFAKVLNGVSDEIEQRMVKPVTIESTPVNRIEENGRRRAVAKG